MQLSFLGSADSGGIPVHNCECEICTEHRVSGKQNLSTCAYIRCKNGQIILLDAGVEAISSIFNTEKIKAVFLTHFHPDHVLGLLRLRYSASEILCFHPKDEVGFSDLFKYPKSIKYIQNEPFKSVTINDIKFTPIMLKHSRNTNGYVIQGDEVVAYLTDCAGIDEDSMSFLKQFKFDRCYIDACSNPAYHSKNHINYEQATEILDTLAPKEGFFMHACHETLLYIKQNNIKLKYKYVEPG
ncbi:MBL fold metallo-hydrolase [Campylobacter suis]|uniref:Phosphoribosyl 1,2-cyclic phosphate phosphodiesterase n=1 Tax=Campylobacter suis TaxID=2790657 RepID=A0ABM8Q8P5_9BACT|nr:MBL fold metallo-hydrolase [Campylobacter suis]CAD7289339.1 Phosphoribosyl 1,2-cyclic phosphate phosphodiesterase [Campylobacter suis]